MANKIDPKQQGGSGELELAAAVNPAVAAILAEFAPASRDAAQEAAAREASVASSEISPEQLAARTQTFSVMLATLGSQFKYAAEAKELAAVTYGLKDLEPFIANFEQQLKQLKESATTDGKAVRVELDPQLVIELSKNDPIARSLAEKLGAAIEIESLRDPLHFAQVYKPNAGGAALSVSGGETELTRTDATVRAEFSSDVMTLAARTYGVANVGPVAVDPILAAERIKMDRLIIGACRMGAYEYKSKQYEGLMISAETAIHEGVDPSCGLAATTVADIAAGHMIAKGQKRGFDFNTLADGIASLDLRLDRSA
jgi:hypothetical protein